MTSVTSVAAVSAVAVQAQHLTRDGSSAVIARPILKTAGGKGRLLDEIIPRVPQTFQRYIEPFFGGGAVLFALVSGERNARMLEPGSSERDGGLDPRDVIIGDANDDLISTYLAIATDCERVIAMLADHAIAHGEDEHLHYYAVRALYNDRAAMTHPTARAAAYLYLNHTCWNGLHRVNRKGHFNVPIGNYKDPRICDADGLRAASRVLSAALSGHPFLSTDYKIVCSLAQSGDFVYLDPPYDGTFTSYTVSPFGQAQQRELASIARGLVTNGVQVMLSNADTSLVRDLYPEDHWRIQAISRPGTINSKANGRGAVAELLIMGGYDAA